MGLGLNALLTWLEVRRLPYRRLAVITFALLGFFNLYLFTDALRNGALWPTDYTLGGVQWGARQLFGQAVPDLLEADPELQVYVSPNWANGTELLPQFFMTPAQMDRMQLQGVEHYLTERRDLPANLIVVLMANEYERLSTDPKFANVRVEQVLNYPNGSPGFYFVRFDYSAEAEALFGAQHAALSEPVTESFTLDAELVTITHPQFGAGQLNDLLDGDRFTLINAPGANPLSLDFVFEQPRALNEVTLITGSLTDMTIKVLVYAADAAEPMVYGEQYVGLPPDPTIVIAFAHGPALVQRAVIEITDNLGTSESVNVHVREVQFR